LFGSVFRAWWDGKFNSEQMVRVCKISGAKACTYIKYSDERSGLSFGKKKRIPLLFANKRDERK